MQPDIHPGDSVVLDQLVQLLGGDPGFLQTIACGVDGEIMIVLDAGKPLFLGRGNNYPIAVEGARNGILSNVIMPVARTRMTEELLGPLAEHMSPELVTPMVVYLASAASDFMTGQTLFLDGGQSAA